ncbi:MAG: helix-turn-helix transcriptional regulator [Pseudomonadota bacterium]
MQNRPEDHQHVPASDNPHRARQPQSLDVSIGGAIKRLRRLRGLSQQALGARCGLSFQQIQKYEAGTNRIPASRLFDLARVLETTPTELLAMAWKGDEEEPDIALRERLSAAGQQLSGETLISLVTIAEGLAASQS